MKRLFMGIFCFTLLNCVSSNRVDRERATLHLQIGTGYLQSGQYPLAMSELMKAQELDPKNPLIQNNLGLAFYVRGRLKQAEEHFREAIKLEPKYSDAKNNLGRVLIDSQHYEEAVRVLHEVEGDLTYPNPEKTLSNLG